MILDCDWSISVQLIPNRGAKICCKSAKTCNSAKICNKREKIVTSGQKSVTTVQNFIKNESDWHNENTPAKI